MIKIFEICQTKSMAKQTIRNESIDGSYSVMGWSERLLVEIAKLLNLIT